MVGNVKVQSSTDFAKVAGECCKNITVIHYSKEEILNMAEALEAQWSGILPIPCTKSIHKVHVISPDVIEYKEHDLVHKYKSHCFRETGVN